MYRSQNIYCWHLPWKGANNKKHIQQPHSEQRPWRSLLSQQPTPDSNNWNTKTPPCSEGKQRPRRETSSFSGANQPTTRVTPPQTWAQTLFGRTKHALWWSYLAPLRGETLRKTNAKQTPTQTPIGPRYRRAFGSDSWMLVCTVVDSEKSETIHEKHDWANNARRAKH